mmetsp:Transcript_22773/g.54477  ORF Transcript_22773/g.54477 Transcript_22773/m.54477 type:complete len:315 (-) Transcript_22773:1165-2109(-)
MRPERGKRLVVGCSLHPENRLRLGKDAMHGRDPAEEIHVPVGGDGGSVSAGVVIQPRRERVPDPLRPHPSRPLEGMEGVPALRTPEPVQPCLDLRKEALEEGVRCLASVDQRFQREQQRRRVRVRRNLGPPARFDAAPRLPPDELLARDPTVRLHQPEPVEEDVSRDGRVPLGKKHQMEPVVPEEPAREPIPARCRTEGDDGRLFRRGVVEGRVRLEPCPGEVRHPTQKLAESNLAEFLSLRGVVLPRTRLHPSLLPGSRLARYGREREDLLETHVEQPIPLNHDFGESRPREVNSVPLGLRVGGVRGEDKVDH